MNSPVKGLEQSLVKTKIELDSHAYTHFVVDHCLIVHDHNRPVNVFGYDPRMALKNACIGDAFVAFTEPETCKLVIFLIN